MRSLGDKYLRVCPRSGKIVGLKSPRGFAIALVPLIGLLALGWIVFRVATKPSRIAYPCVRAAMPLASGLIGYVLSVAASLGLWATAKRRQTVPAMIFTAFLACLGLFLSYTFVNDPAVAIERQLPTLHLNANEPIGTAVGMYPGRVVWVHRPEATRDACSPASVGHEWYRPENYDQSVIDTMVSSAICRLTGTITDAAAWDAIFKFHNSTRGKGAVGYASGEKILIKTNATSSWGGQFNTSDLSAKTGVWYYAVSETSPGIVLSILRQLVNVAGVAQADIYVGDPMKHIYKHCYDVWHAEFPDVHYLDADGYTNLGREKAVKSTTARIQYSDRGTVLKLGGTTGTAITEDFLYEIFDQAEYMLNIPMLKGHKRAGVTMFAKNHFGSHTRSSATHIHGGLVTPNEYPNSPYRMDYGLYRVQVDLMGHELLGKKNLFYVMDALWATDWELDIPVKWKMSPFNDDWMSSVFASFDPVAIESVGYDFLRAEFTEARGAGTYPQMPAVDDYLHQAADTTNWAAGVRYDPENNGTVLASLGTHEHWNDSLHMQYSRNLGTGNGIELVRADASPTASTRTYTVADAWNLISLPLSMDDLAKTSLYPTAVSSAFAYVTGYVAKDTLANGVAYWLQFPSSQNVTFTGFPLARITIPVKGGWNMIGSIGVPVPVNQITSIPPGMTVSPFYTYVSSYTSVTSIEPHMGYWVKASRDGELILDAVGGAQGTVNIVDSGELPPDPVFLTSVSETRVPTAFSLEQNYPNPFNPTTTIRYTLPVRSYVTLTVFDPVGREISRLVNQEVEAGYHTVEFNASGLASGVLFYRLQAGGFVQSHKVVFLR